VPDDHPFGLLFSDPEVRALFDGTQIEERLDGEVLSEFPHS
jgi:hypothetical protein